MISTRILVSTLLIGLVPALAACGSDSKKPNNSANPWQNKTYQLSIPLSRWNKPNKDVANDIGAFVPSFLLYFKSATATDVDVLLGTSDANGVQDPCSPTTLIHGTSAYPDFKIGPVDAPVRIVDTSHNKAVTITGYGLTLANIMPESTVDNTTEAFSATVDARQLYPLFYLIADPTPDKVCADLSQVSAECQQCPSDQQNYCLTLGAISLTAALTGASVNEVGASDLPASCNAATSADAGADGGA